MGSPKIENRVENQEEETTPSPPKTERKPKRCSPRRPDFHFVVCPKAPMMARSPDLFGGEKQRVYMYFGWKQAMNNVHSNSLMLYNIYIRKKKRNVYNILFMYIYIYIRIAINNTSYIW